VWFGSVERVSLGQFVPLRQARVEDPVDDDVGDGGVIGMHTRAGGGEHSSGSVDPKQACNQQPRLHGIADEAVLQRERRALHTENGSGAGRLRVPGASIGVPRRLAVAQIHEQNRLPSARQLRRCAAHDHFQIVRVGAKGENVVPLIHLIGEMHVSGKRDTGRACQFWDGFSEASSRSMLALARCRTGSGSGVLPASRQRPIVSRSPSTSVAQAAQSRQCRSIAWHSTASSSPSR
jgi:hypothetical protein